MIDRRPEVRGAIAIASLLVITILGAALRLHIANVESMWFDEAQTIAIASEAFPAGIIRGLVNDGNSPLFYLAEHFAVAPRHGSFRELRDRAISVVFGIGLIPLSFVLGRALTGGNSPSGLALATWVAFAPIVVDAATQARPYSLLLFAVALLALAFNRVACTSTGWGWYALASVSVLYLHTLAASVLAAFAILLLVVSRRRFTSRWLVWHAALAVAAVPALLLIMAQVRGLTEAGRIPWGRDTELSGLKGHLFALLTGSEFGTLQPIAGWVVAGMLTAAMVAGTPAVRLMGAAAVLALVMAIAVSFHSAGLVTRYSLPISLLLVTVACTIFRALPAAVSAVLMVLYVAFAVASSDYYAVGRRSSSRATAELILAQARPDDVVMIVPDMLAGAVNYYLPPRFQQLDPPSLTRVSIVDWRGWKESFSDSSRLRAIEKRLERSRMEGRRVWLVVALGLTTAVPLESDGHSMLDLRWAFSQQIRETFDRHYAAPRLTRLLRSREGCAVTLGVPRR